MKICAQWMLELLPWLEHISSQELNKRMAILGHRANISNGILNFFPSENRRDLNCVNGVLREIAAAFGKRLDIPCTEIIEEDIGSIYERVDADVWSESVCNRFTAKICVNLQKGKTPSWMKDRLLAAGLVYENTVQDIASYVFLEYGQPVLLLDGRSICDGSLTIREAMGYETANDNLLPYGMPILESGEEILAVPHYWISDFATVKPDSQEILIVAVNYPNDVLEGCNESFSTVACAQDPLLTMRAVERTSQLMQQLGYGHVLDGSLDILNYVPNPVKLDLKEVYEQDNSISCDEFVTILSLIGFDEDGTIPSWRSDLGTAEAIRSEVSRLHRAIVQTNDIFSV